MNIEKVKVHIKSNISIYIAIMVALIFAIIGYFWVPRQEYDLYQYYSWMEKMNYYNISELISYFIARGEPITMIYFYIIAKIGNFQLLQVLPTFLFYFIAFYMLIDYAKLRQISQKKVIFVALILMALVEYIFIMGCFRYTLAYVIFALALYLNYVKNKKSKWIGVLYIIPCLIHTSAFILLALRLIIMIKNKKVLVAILSAVSIILFFPQPFIWGIQQVLGDSNELISKLKLYFIDSRNEMQLSLQYCFRIMQNFSLIFANLYFNYVNKKDNNLFVGYDKFLNILSMVVIICIPYQTVFFRFTDMFLIAMLVKLLEILHTLNSKKEKYLFYSCCILFIIAGVRIQIPVFQLMYQ